MRGAGQARNARYAWILGAGGVILMLSRPFEGVLLLAPVLGALVRGARWRGVWGPIVVCGLAGASWLAFYNYKVTGHPLRLPYREYGMQYETVPPFTVLPVTSANPEYRHADLEWIDKGWMSGAYRQTHTWRFPLVRIQDWYTTLKTILGSAIPIVPLLGFAPQLFRSRRTRFPACLAVIIFAGSLPAVPQYSHYPAPFVGVVFILAVQSPRYLRHAVSGKIFSAGMVLLFASIAGSDASALYRQVSPDRFRAAVWKKGTIEVLLAAKSPGRHVVFVHYTRFRYPHEEWIYNSAAIDSQAVIWAQDMGVEKNRQLIGYFPGRSFWRFGPDESSDALVPYE